MSSSSLVFTYLIVLLTGIAILTIYSEFRSQRFRPSHNADRIFRCEKCGCVYTDDPDVDRSRCSQCGTSNEAIKF